MQQPKRCIHSGVVPVVVSDVLNAALTRDIQENVMRILLDVNGMAVVDKMANGPKQEGNYKGPCKLNLDVPAPRTAAPAVGCAGATETCPGCFDAATMDASACFGCSVCVGRSFECNTCQRKISVVVTYEKGTGRSSIGRDIHKFEVPTATPAIVELSHLYALQCNKPQVYFNSCSLVVYTPGDICSRCTGSQVCATARDHSATCSDVLNFHCDCLKLLKANETMSSSTSTTTINTQEDHTDIMTFNKGGGRNVAVRIVPLKKKGELSNKAILKNYKGEDFALGDSSTFKLSSKDEIVRDGWVCMHGMQTPLRLGEISTGLVFRRLCSFGCRDDRTNYLIPMTSASRKRVVRAQKLWNTRDHAMFAAKTYTKIVDALQGWPHNSWGKSDMLAHARNLMRIKPTKYVD